MYRKNGYVWLLAKDTTLNENPMRLLTVPHGDVENCLFVSFLTLC